MAAKTPSPASDPVALWARITEMVAKNAVAMVQCARWREGRRAIPGNQIFVEMVGIYPATVVAEDQQADSLTQTLLKNLGLPEQDISEPTRRD
jgi:hypothetical protein